MVCSAPGKHMVWTCSTARCRLLRVSRGVNETRDPLIQWQLEQWKANCISKEVVIWPLSFCLSTFIASSCFICTPKAPGGRQDSKSSSFTWHFSQPGDHFQDHASLNQPASAWMLQIMVESWHQNAWGYPSKQASLTNTENERILPRLYSSTIRWWLGVTTDPWTVCMICNPGKWSILNDCCRREGEVERQEEEVQIFLFLALFYRIKPSLFLFLTVCSGRNHHVMVSKASSFPCPTTIISLGCIIVNH